MKITKFYGIHDRVPFVDVDTKCDTRLFCQPFWIRRHVDSCAHAQSAWATIRSFDSTWVKLTLQQSRDEMSWLFRFPEAHEFRLGYARSNYAGRGSGEIRSQSMVDALLTDLNLLVLAGVLHHYEAIALFVSGVSRDVISDMTLNVVRGPLIAFTQKMMIQYPALADGASTHTFRVWSIDQSRWDYVAVEVPTIAGKPVLLVPLSWCDSRQVISPDGYYKHIVAEECLKSLPAIDEHPRRRSLFYEKYPLDFNRSILTTLDCKEEKELNLVDTFYSHRVIQFDHPIEYDREAA